MSNPLTDAAKTIARAVTPEDAVDQLVAEGWTPPDPPPLTVEPDDLAARVLDRTGDEWARRSSKVRGAPADVWFSCSGTSVPRTWDRLVANGSPLTLGRAVDLH